MKIEVLENALSGINEKTLDSVLSERHKRMEKGRMSASVSETKRKSFFSLKKAIAVAAGFAVILCSMAIIIPLSTRNSVNVDDPNTAEQFNTPAESVPQYIPEFGTPTLEEVYTITPYSELLPKRLLSNCSFSGSYMTEYDPVSNPDGHKFLALIFKTGNESWDTMEIKVSEYDGTSVLADINDKRTYALSYLYGNDSPPAGNTLAGFSDLFHAEDITIDIVKEMVYTLPDGLCKAEISLLCGDYIVSYAYTGAEITVESFYDMIVSSEWLEK